MIDWLWLAAVTSLIVALTGNLTVKTWVAHRRRLRANRQKTFSMSMRLPDRMKLDLR